MSAHADHHEPAGYEKSDVAVGKVVLVTGISVAFVAVVLITLFQMFSFESEQQIQQVVLAPESTALRDLRAREDAELNSYGVVDTSQGRYRIPIERAMQLMADEAYRRQTAGTVK